MPLITNTVSCLPWSDRMTSFSRKCLLNIHVWITTVCPLFQVKVVFHEKAVSLAHKSRVTRGFPGDRQCTWVSYRSAIYVLPFHHAEYLKDPYKGSDLPKLILLPQEYFLYEIDFFKRIVHDGKRHAWL